MKIDSSHYTFLSILVIKFLTITNLRISYHEVEKKNFTLKETIYLVVNALFQLNLNFGSIEMEIK